MSSVGNMEIRQDTSTEEKGEGSMPPSISPSQITHDFPQSQDLVDFDGPDDPYNPLNWPFAKKVVVTMLYSVCTMGTTWASTIFNSGIPQIEKHFGVSTEVALLGMSLFLFGNAFGPLLWAPMSEAFGRRPALLIPTFGLAVFSWATATAKDIQTLLITRFFSGVFGGAPLCITGGVLADIWPVQQRGAALLLWGLCVIIGPLVAPIVGAALVVNMSTVGWRWTEYLTGILLTVILVASIIWVDESSVPILLARKADRIRFETKNWAIHSKSQEIGTSLKGMSRKYLIIPFDMMVDPIAVLLNIYTAFCYAIIYLAILAFPIEFNEVRHWKAVVGSVPFMAIVVGVLFGSLINLWGFIYYKGRFVSNGSKIVPEARLPPMMIGSLFFTSGLFIMGWTAKADVHWIGFCVGAACLGLGFFPVFQSALNYLVDTYSTLAASVLATNMFMRSMLAGAFPLFARALFHNLGLDWGMSLLGFIAATMLPIPYLFYIYGKPIRAAGKHSRKTFVP